MSPPLSPLPKGMIRGLSRLNYSSTMTINEMKKAKEPISSGSVSNLKKNMTEARQWRESISTIA